jgi:hypothetical protein
MIEAIRSPRLWERLQAGIRAPMTAAGTGERHAELFGKLLDRRAGRRPAPLAAE